MSKLRIWKCQRGKHLKFCLFPEFRHLSVVRISLYGTKICNQNALPALLYVSYMKFQQRELSSAFLSEDNQWEKGGGGGDIAKHILHNSFAMKVLAAFSWPIFGWKWLWDYAMCWSWCCHYAWSELRAHPLNQATGRTYLRDTLFCNPDGLSGKDVHLDISFSWECDIFGCVQ